MARATEVPENRFIYHYCTSRHVDGGVEVIDGIAQLTFRIISMDDYGRFKSLIANQCDTSNNMSITSLSFIGMEIDA